MMLHYDLIGTHPQVQGVNIEATVAAFKAAALGSTKTRLGSTLARVAEHFYGLSLADFTSVNFMVDHLVAMEQHVAVH